MPVSKDALQWALSPAFPAREPLGSATKLDARGRPSEQIHVGVSRLLYTTLELLPVMVQKNPTDTIPVVAKKSVKAASELLEAVFNFRNDE